MSEPRLWSGRPVVAGLRMRTRALALLCAAMLALAGCDLLAPAPEPTVTPLPTAPPPPIEVTATPPASPPPPETPTPTPVVPAPPQPTPTPQPAPPEPTASPPAPTPTRQAPTPTPTVAVRGRVGVAAVARAIDSMQRPRDRASEFESGERVYVSAEFIGVGAGSTIGIAWNRGEESVFTYEQPVPSAFTRGYFAFYLDPGDATPGAYSAKVLIDGQVQREVSFTIRA